MIKKLTLRESEELKRAILSVLLTFLHARIARQKSVLAQRRPQFRVEPRNGPRQSHAHRSRLPAHAAAMRRHYHVNLVGDIRKFQRLHHRMLPRVLWEILLDRPGIQDGLSPHP